MNKLFITNEIFSRCFNPRVKLHLHFTYLGLAILLLFFNSAISGNEEPPWYMNIDCVTTNQNGDRVECSANASTLTKDYPTLPLDTIPNPEKVKIIVADYPTNGSWQIIDHKVFHRFENLQRLRLKGAVFIPTKFHRKKMKNALIDEFFNLPNLTDLELWHWCVHLDDSYVWKFPAKIKSLELWYSCSSGLNLRSYRDLTHLHLLYNGLNQLPELPAPSPLVVLRLIELSTWLQFTAHDIVQLCSLKYLGVTFDEITLDRRTYRDCCTLQTYMNDFEINVIDYFECNYLGLVRSDFDCETAQDYTAKRSHIDACKDTDPHGDVETLKPFIGPKNKTKNIHVQCNEKNCNAFMIADVVLLIILILIIRIFFQIVYRRETR